MAGRKKTENTIPLFEGHEVGKSAIRITNAGDGLSDALEMDPKALDLGDVQFYVLSGVVTQVNHVQKDTDGPLVRLHTIKASQITEVDPDTATAILDAAAAALAAAKAERDGQPPLDFDKDTADAALPED